MGVMGRSLEREVTLVVRPGRGGGGVSSGASDCDGAAEDVTDDGTSSLTMACSIAGRTLKFFSCLLRSDLAAFGAFLS